MTTRFEEFLQYPEFKNAVMALQTEVFDLEDASQYRAFMNAIGVIMNVGFAEGYEHGVDGMKQCITLLSVDRHRESVVANDRRTLDVVEQQRQLITENPQMPLDAGVENLGLRMTPYSRIYRAGIRTIADLLTKRDADIVEMMTRVPKPERMLMEVKDQLAQFGYSLRADNTSNTQTS